MKSIKISDVTMQQGDCLSFKEKIELAKLLDKLGVSVIELDGIKRTKIDTLLIKSIALAVKQSIVAVPVELNAQSVAMSIQALKEAKHPRLQVRASVSAVQMEYLFHKKPEAMLASIEETVKNCREVCDDVEFIADDATRSDSTFLIRALKTAMDAGAQSVTLCDAAGTMLPDEFKAFVQSVYDALPELKEIHVGVRCNDTLSMANACVVASLSCGVDEIKAAVCPRNTASVENIARVIAAKEDAFALRSTIQTTQMRRICKQIERMCTIQKSDTSPFESGVREGDESDYLTVHDDVSTVAQAVVHLGYDLSEEDSAAVYEAFKSIAEKKEKVSAKELDAIVASAAMQVPPTYVLDNYVITAGNTISATAHMKLKRQDANLERVCIGDGPIDAAFLAIEQIVGRHYELDDFQIQSVTEGTEAMGQTVVKLRSEGKLYSGCGISTDIVGSSIRAYLSALNKIVYEEAEV
ncbi:MAG: hypothetical protein E7434_00260 [Ruminococcaceae bacterium]|nr:hypothetical protein [Oscillospiraceae bacterium]